TYVPGRTPDSAKSQMGLRNSATITPLTATGRNLPTEILFAVSGPFLRQPTTGNSHRYPFAFSQWRTNGIVVTDGQVRVGAEGRAIGGGRPLLISRDINDPASVKA